MIRGVKLRPSRFAVLLVCVAAAACRRAPESAGSASPTPVPTPRAANAAFVGREACARCHAEEERRWRGSHHDLAMQEANDKTVLGDFANARFTHFGVASTFFRRDGRYWVRTDGPDGRLHEYPIAYTFGVYPLQQYLIAFPGGRYQALNVCWDARPKAEGGQRWFHLYPKEAVAHDDPLHWTGPYQNWNFMCAECHSTNVKKGYAAASDTYATTWSELDVSCEACHGPGSAHVAWAEAVAAGRARKDDRDKGMVVDLKDPGGPAEWIFDPQTGIAKRSIPRTSQTEIETCARCHARRSVVAAEYVYGQSLLQTHRPALLTEGTYYADGQIEDEDYEYGSFLQSKMHAAGVSCTNCHNPHDLKVAGSADRVCAGCHQPDRFDTPKHHFHKTNSRGASCVACHMPTRDYMVVHGRHDHSFRIPRPDLTVSIGTPNACTSCHADKPPQWAADAALRWWGDRVRKEPHYGEIVHAGREELAGAAAGLVGYVADSTKPAIRRASAATLLGGQDAGDPAAATRALSHAAADPNPLVRLGAIDGVEALPAEARAPLLAPLLRDPVLTVRIEAARALLGAPNEAMSAGERTDFDAALADFVKSQNVDADRGEAHLNLAAVALARGDLAAAEAEYRTAIARSPGLGGAWANLADLYRMQGRESEAEQTLRRGLEVAPRDPGVHHALGLALVRQKRLPEALKELRLAAEIPPGRPHYAYVYGVALDAAGRTGEALKVLEAASARHPGDRELAEAIAAFRAKKGTGG